MVFQEMSLVPTLTVAQNTVMGPRSQGVEVAVVGTVDLRVSGPGAWDGDDQCVLHRELHGMLAVGR